jgi:threonine/homoserine/homoserine lactone efflux protein
MLHLPLFLFAVALGVVAAIPIGPVQVEVAKRAIAGHLWAAHAVVLGSVTSDIVYGAVALFGMAPFLAVPRVLASLSALGAGALWVLAYATWRASRRPHELHLEQSSLGRRRWGYLTGFTLGSANPPIILSWVLGVALATRLGLASPLTHTAKLWFVAGGALGLGGYLAALAVAVHRVRHFISLRAIGRVYFWLAVTLVVLSAFFVYGAAAYVLQGGAGV